MKWRIVLAEVWAIVFALAVLHAHAPHALEV